MKRLNIWRMEDSNGRGPYTAPFSSHLAKLRDVHNCDSVHWGWKHPSVGLRDCHWDEWVAGCPSRQALEDWFEGFHEDLRLAGFRLMSYYIPMDRVRLGKDPRQLAFVKGRVKGVEHL